MANKGQYDVIIVGGGPAGLKAADTLIQGGLKVLLLESRDRVGGRVYSKPLESGTYIELGAQWQSKTDQDNLEELVQRFKFKKTQTFREGKSVVWTSGGDKKLLPFDDTGMSVLGMIDTAWVAWKLLRNSRGINLDRPIKGKEVLDRIPASEFINSNMCTKNGREQTLYALEGIFCVDNLDDISVFTLAYFLKTVPESLSSISDGDYYYFTEGLGNLFARYADTFSDSIKLNSKVVHIDSSSSPIVVTTKSNEQFTADNVVIAFPPQLLPRIEFEPPLPNEYQITIESQVLGRVLKLVGEFPTPWWRERGFNGNIITFGDKFLAEAYDVSHPGAGIIAGFVMGRRAQEALELGKGELTKKFNHFMEECFGEGGEPLKELHYHDWMGDEDTVAAYISTPGIGVWKHHPNGFFHTDGPIYFAGTEYTERWFGAIEGGLESGKRVAEKILETK